MIQGIDHIAIFVTDMDRAVEFYTQTLGLELGYRSPHWTEVMTPGVYIGLHPAEAVAGAKSGKATTQISFKVSNIKEVQQELQSRGITFSREINEISPGKWMANFSDPDGNQLSIYEVKE